MATRRQLEVFVAVVRHRGFRRAADLLGISEASVSKQISALERSYGLILFVREKGRCVQLSQDGQAFLESAEKTLSLQDEMRRIASTGPERIFPEVFVRAFMMEKLVKPNIADFYANGLHANAVFKAFDDLPETIRHVAANRYALSVFRGSRPADAGVGYRPVCTTRLSIYAPARLHGKAPETLPLVVPAQDRLVKDLILTAIDTPGVAYSHVIEVNNFIEGIVEEAERHGAMFCALNDHVSKAEPGYDIRVVYDSVKTYETCIAYNLEAPDDFVHASIAAISRTVTAIIGV